MGAGDFAMSNSSNSHGEPHVPTALLKRHRADWHMFTRAVIYNCIAVAGLLLFLLLVFRIL
jgi:hypothetical protein